MDAASCKQDPGVNLIIIAAASLVDRELTYIDILILTGSTRAQRALIVRPPPSACAEAL